MVLKKYYSSLPFISQVRSGGRGMGGGLFIFLETTRALVAHFFLCDPEPSSASAAKIACKGFTFPLTKDLNSFRLYEDL